MIFHQRVCSVHLSDEGIQFTNQRTVKGLLLAVTSHSADYGRTAGIEKSSHSSAAIWNQSKLKEIERLEYPRKQPFA